MQGLGVYENETFWRETFIWISQQVSPKCVLCSITTKHTARPDWFDILSGPWIWQIGRERKGIFFFFNAICAFSALPMSTFLVHPILWVNKEIKFRYKDSDQQIRQMHFLVRYQLDSRTIFLYQLPTTYTWCKEIQGRNQSHLPRLKTLPRNYSQTTHFSPAFMLHPPSLTLKQICRTRCQSSSINREIQHSDLVASFPIAVLPYWLFPTIRGPCFPQNALNISRLSYYPPLCGCYLQTCPLFHVFFFCCFVFKKKIKSTNS